jgi:predicted nucleotidyltransferase|tara:strand:- start:400 stop:603 length:204 start_codon:yes stop_codon:yes gene_type:complete
MEKNMEKINRDIDILKKDILKIMDKMDNFEQTIINIKWLLKRLRKNKLYELQNIVDQQSFEDHKGVK